MLSAIDDAIEFLGDLKLSGEALREAEAIYRRLLAFRANVLQDSEVTQEVH